MNDDIHERIAKTEESLKTAHKRIDYVEEKKLSKHEFNGFAQVMEAVKSAFSESIGKLSKTTESNVVAINSLQTTFENIEKFLPMLIKVIVGLGGTIVLLLLFIGARILGLWQ